MDRQYSEQDGSSPPLLPSDHNAPGLFSQYFHHAPLTALVDHNRNDTAIQDGNQNAAHQRDAMAQDEGDGEGEGEGDDEFKRRRTARACDMCRKRKVKCDGKSPKCTHCAHYRIPCIFTQTEKVRQPTKSAKYIQGLESRLLRVEALLEKAGLDVDDDGYTDASEKTKVGMSTCVDGKTSIENKAIDVGKIQHSNKIERSIPVASLNSLAESSATLPAPAIKSVPARGRQLEDVSSTMENLTDQMSSLITNDAGETRCFGSSSGFSIFSPKGIRWVNERLGDSSIHHVVSGVASYEDTCRTMWNPDVFDDIFSRPVYRELPLKDETLTLLREFFEQFNSVYPLFHQPSFMRLVEQHFSHDPIKSPGWWASINSVLAISYRLRASIEKNPRTKDDDDKAWSYLKNAMAVHSELILRNRDLLGVQALLAMALFLQSTPNPQPSNALIASAIHSAQGIGVHKNGAGFNLTEDESEQRKRVFWIGYMMDKEQVASKYPVKTHLLIVPTYSVSLRSGRPPVQEDDDMNVELPSKDPADNVGVILLHDGKTSLNLFRIKCVFATIQSKVYKRLHSVSSTRQSDSERLETIGELDEELQNWKDLLPIDLRPGRRIRVHGSHLLQAVKLHLAYYSCLTTIHRMSILQGFWNSRSSDHTIADINVEPPHPRIFVSATICVHAARSSLSLVKYIPHHNHAYIWPILYYAISALITMFANILQNPQDPRAHYDVQLMGSLSRFLATHYESNGNIICRKLLLMCNDFERLAKMKLAGAMTEASGSEKRKSRVDHDVSFTRAKTQRQNSPPKPQSAQQPSPSSIPESAQEPSPMTNQSNEAQSSPSAPTPIDKPNSWPTQDQYGLSTQFWPNPVLSADHADFQDQSKTFPASSFPTEHLHNLPDYLSDYPNSGLSGNFLQPFIPSIPQDLWRMPTSLDWGWTDLYNADLGSGPGGPPDAGTDTGFGHGSR